MGSWYETGYSVISKEEERQASSQMPNTFWVSVGSSKPIIFIDDDPFSIYEHTIRLNNERFYRPVTCIRGMYPDDPICCVELGARDAALVGYTTIVDCSEKKDPKYGYELQLFQGKLRTLKKLQLKKNTKGSLVNMKWTVSRTDTKSPRCGDDFEWVQDVKSMEKLFSQVTYRGKRLAEIFDQANKGGPEAIAKVKKIFQVTLDANGKIMPAIPAFNYLEILKPQEPNAVRVLLKARAKEEDKSAIATGLPGTTDDLPF